MARGFKMKGFSAFSKTSPMKNVGNEGLEDEGYRPTRFDSPRENVYDRNTRDLKIRGVTQLPDVEGVSYGGREYDFTPDQFHKMMNMRLPEDHPNYHHLKYFKAKHKHAYSPKGSRGIKVSVPAWRQSDRPYHGKEGQDVEWVRGANPWSSSYRYDLEGNIIPGTRENVHGPHYTQLEGLDTEAFRGENRRGYQGFLERSLDNMTRPKLKPISTEKIMNDYLSSRPEPTLAPRPSAPTPVSEERPVVENRQPVKDARITTDVSGRTIVTPTDSPQRLDFNKPERTGVAEVDIAEMDRLNKPKPTSKRTVRKKPEIKPKKIIAKKPIKKKKSSKGGTDLAAMKAGNYIPQSMRGKS